MDENEMVDVKVSTELAKRLEKMANAAGITVDLLLRKMIADATV
ncbi:MAG: hypothetical protein WB643_06150 [Candidatus Bathyarchaeia archaeon]